MAKNILVPIDFCVESLNVLKFALDRNSESIVNATLLYAGLPGNSLTDLFFYSQRDFIRTLMHPEFEQALQIIRNCYENSLRSLSIQVLQSDTDAALDGIVLRHAITDIFVPRDYQLTEIPGGFNPLPRLRKYPLPVHEVAWTSPAQGGNPNQLASLFKIFEN